MVALAMIGLSSKASTGYRTPADRYAEHVVDEREEPVLDIGDGRSTEPTTNPVGRGIRPTIFFA
jgi:hypothetical protein